MTVNDGCKWLFEAKKRYGLRVLNDTVTSNPIHLLAQDGEQEVISKSLQPVGGKTAQEYNRRKNRKGAFWEDRYHATAIETGEHFIACLVYIDLNMVRNGVVDHPSAWAHGGYNEIQNPPPRYRLIDRERLIHCCGLENDMQLREVHGQWACRHNGRRVREPQWTESIAVGSAGFVEKIKEQLQPRIPGRRVRAVADQYELREQWAAYNADNRSENGLLSTGNTYYLDLTFA